MHQSKSLTLETLSRYQPCPWHLRPKVSCKSNHATKCATAARAPPLKIWTTSDWASFTPRAFLLLNPTTATTTTGSICDDWCCYLDLSLIWQGKRHSSASHRRRRRRRRYGRSTGEGDAKKFATVIDQDLPLFRLSCHDWHLNESNLRVLLPSSIPQGFTDSRRIRSLSVQVRELFCNKWCSHSLVATTTPYRISITSERAKNWKLGDSIGSQVDTQRGSLLTEVATQIPKLRIEYWALGKKGIDLSSGDKT